MTLYFLHLGVLIVAQCIGRIRDEIVDFFSQDVLPFVWRPSFFAIWGYFALAAYVSCYESDLNVGLKMVAVAIAAPCVVGMDLLRRFPDENMKFLRLTVPLYLILSMGVWGSFTVRPVPFLSLNILFFHILSLYPMLLPILFIRRHRVRLWKYMAG